MPLKFIPTNIKYNDSGEFKNISIPADRAYMDEIITVSSTQPTNSDNKLWINTNEQTAQTYQIPTMADMANYRTAADQDAIDAGFCPYNQISVTGHSNYKMTLPSLSGHFVFIVSSSLSRSAILYIVVQASGDVAVEEIQKGTNFTYTVGTNEVTFSTGATYAVYIKEIPIRGDLITVEPVE